jgi:hypothetical protein
VILASCLLLASSEITAASSFLTLALSIYESTNNRYDTNMNVNVNALTQCSDDDGNENGLSVREVMMTVMPLSPCMSFMNVMMTVIITS